MNVTFIKDHVSGLLEGRVIEVSKKHGERLIEEGYARESSDSEIKDFHENNVTPKVEKTNKNYLLDQIKTLDIKGLQDFAENANLGIEINDSMPIEEAREFVELALEEKNN